MIGGPYTEQAATGFDSSAIPMPDEQAADPIADTGDLTPNFGLPRLMHEDGLPEDYLGRAFSAPIEAGADPMQQAPEQEIQKADIQQPTPTADIETEQPRQGSGFQARVTAPQFNPRYRYTQEDFYGQPKGPITWTDPRGVQMYVPEAGRLPMAVWASRMQQVQGDREQNKATMTKFMSELGKGIKTADPYQESLNQAVSAARNRFVGDLAAQYGGNDALAWKEIAEDPQTQQRFIDLHRKFEAIGQHGMQSWERARGYLDALEKGGVHVDPETKRLAEEVYYGLGSMRGDEDIADIDKLVRNINKFEHSVSRDEYAKQWLLPNLEKRYRQYATDVQARRQNGIGILEWDQVFDGKAFIEEAARSMTDAIAGSTYEENKQWMERNFPAENIEKNVKTYALPKPPKGGGDGGDGSAVKRPIVVPSVVQTPATTSGGVTRGPQDRIMLTPYQTTGDKSHKVGKMNVVIGDQPQDIYAPSLTWDEKRGEFMISGTSLSESEEREVERLADSGWTQPKEGEAWNQHKEAIISKSKVGSRVLAPLSTNSDAGRVYWGSANGYDVVANALAEQGISLTAEEVKQALQDKEGIKYIQSIFRGQ